MKNGRSKTKLLYTIHQYLSNLNASFEDIEKGNLENLLYAYPAYRTEKSRLYQMICQKRGASYPKRLHKLGVALNWLEVDKHEMDDHSLRCTLRRGLMRQKHFAPLEVDIHLT